MFDIQQKFKLSGIAALLALAMAGCGGGSSTTPATNTSTETSNTSSLNLKVADTLSVPLLLGDGGGGWGGDGGADTGNADGAGAAGDGEFIRFSVRFPNASSATGTLTWTVLVSQYDIQGQTGTLNIERNFAKDGGTGGYKVVSPTTATQANFLVSASGQISGTLPLTIKGETKDTLFNGMRFNNYALPAASDASQAFSEIQGMYAFAGLSANSGSGSNADTNGGFLKINADGTARLCEGQTPADHSSTCLGGLNAKLSFDDPNQRNVLVIKPADQTNSFNALAVVHTFKHPADSNSTGVSMTIDYRNVNTEGINRTGVMFASRLPSTALTPSSAVGAWNVANVVISNPGSSNASSARENVLVAIKDIGGTVKLRPGNSLTTCGTFIGTVTSATGINGALQFKDPNDPISTPPTYLIMMDVDSAVAIQPLDPSYNDTAIALVRRYSTDPTKAPCQPN